MLHLVYKFRVFHLRLCPSACSQYQGLPKQWVSLSNKQTNTQSKNLGPRSPSPFENLNMAEEGIIKTVKPLLSGIVLTCKIYNSKVDSQ